VENHGDDDDAGWGRLVHKNSLAILPAETSGSEYEEWTRE
jgi:hypothetical protein